ncbi:MAG: LytTR family transcriptional regulator [Gammaproteobacteria bacterium]|nr:LytTR family transcriptional regulator [Gammaproteobacteria bacterium]
MAGLRTRCPYGTTIGSRREGVNRDRFTLRLQEPIYYRFGDALDELAALDGLRIHRSAWINRKAIERIQGEGRNMHVVLNNGESFRVSLSNRGAVLNARNASRS